MTSQTPSSPAPTTPTLVHVPRSGGSVAIYGFLYQILAHLARVSEFVLSGRARGDTVDEAQLVLEPGGGGGDAQFEQEGRRFVEQYKTRRRDWTLRTFTSAVIPDFVQAALQEQEFSTTYSFVTNGSCEKLSGLLRLRDELERHGDAFDESLLDDSQSVHTWALRRKITDRALYRALRKIVVKALKGRTCSRAPDAVLQEVLVGLTFQGNLPIETLAAKIDELLRGRVHHLEDVERAREGLVGLLLGRLGSGEVRISPERLLRDANLVGLDLRDVPRILVDARREFDDVATVEGYAANKDVRKSIDWPVSSRALVVFGEGGTGKTWGLLRLASDLLERGKWAVVVTSTGSAAADLLTIVRAAWQTCLHHTTETTLEALGERIRKVRDEQEDPWLYAIVDGVESAGVARQLVRASRRDAIGIRIALSTSQSVAEALRTELPSEAAFHKVEDFGHRELRRFLTAHDVALTDIPAGLFDTLRRPLHAALYCSAIETTAWSPKSEYELLSGVWHRLHAAYNQASHPLDAHCLRSLAREVLHQDGAYPWEVRQFVSSGFSEQALLRLEALGWLRRSSDGRWEVPHFRQLGWAMAEALAEDVQSGRAESSAVAALFQMWNEEPRSQLTKAVDYVLMDTVWILMERYQAEVQVVCSLLDAVSESAGWVVKRELFERLLPTLGGHGAAIAAQFLRSRSADAPDADVYLLRSALAAVAAEDPDSVREISGQLLGSADASEQEIGIAMLRVAPDPAKLDLLWDRHQGLVAGLDGPAADRPYSEYSDSAAALRAMVRCDHAWLRRRILAEPEDSVVLHELCWLLLGLDDEEGRELWMELKSRFLELVRPEKSRCCAQAIARFQDVDEVGWLSAQVENLERDAQAASFCALAAIAPQHALEFLPSLGWDVLYFWRGQWLPLLAANSGDALCDKLLERAEGGEAWRELALTYQGSEELAPAAVVARVLEGVEHYIGSAGPRMSDDEAHRLYHPLEFLGAVASRDALAELRAAGRSRLPHLLVEMLEDRGRRGGRWRDHILESARLVLLRMEARGFSAVVAAEFTSDDAYAHLRGVQWSLVRPTRESLGALRRLALANPTEPLQHHLRFKSIESLACLGARRAVLASASQGVPPDVPEMLAIRGGDRTSAPPGVLRDLIAGDDQGRRSAVLRLYCLGNVQLRTEHLDALVGAMSDPASQRVATLILHAAECKSDAFLEALCGLLRGPLHELAVDVLLATDRDDAVAFLVEHVRGGPAGRVDEHWWSTVIALEGQAAADHLLGVAVDNALAAATWVPTMALAVCARHAPERAERLLFEEAFGGASHEVGRAGAAAEALAPLDLPAALDAAVQLVRKDREDCVAAADRVLRVGGAQGLDELLRLACALGEEAISSAIGRAIRWHPQIDVAEEKVIGLLQSGDQGVRRSGAWVAGWMIQSNLAAKLRDIADSDPSTEVRDAALEALGRRARHSRCAELLQGLATSSRARRWSIVTLLVTLADPYLLGRREVPLSIGQALGGGLAEFRAYLESELKRRRKSVDGAEKKRDVNRAKR